MARRRKKKVDFEGLVGSALFGSLFLGFTLTRTILGAVITAGCVLGLIIGIMIWIRNKREQKLKQSGIRDIDLMDGIQFEHYLRLLFASQGYRVEVTRAAGDYGADLVMQKEGKKIVVQAKRYTKNVGISAIQEVVGSKAYYKADEAWVITNSGFTEAAKNLASSNKVHLINRETLIEMILQMNPALVPNPQKVIDEVKINSVTCDRCGDEMVLRRSSKGQFYGCSAFPNCRNIKALD